MSDLNTIRPELFEMEYIEKPLVLHSKKKKSSSWNFWGGLCNDEEIAICLFKQEEGQKVQIDKPQYILCRPMEVKQGGRIYLILMLIH